MQFPKILSCGLLILLVCWLSVNDAIPLGSDPELEVIRTTTFQPNTEFPETAPITVQPILTSTPISQPHQPRQKGRQSLLEVSDTDNNDPRIHISNASHYSSLKSHHTDFEEWEIPLNKVQLNDKCVNEGRRQNQTYTRSIPLNISSIDPDEDFKIPGEPEVKKTSSVHTGEDIAICWIETTTIKEDNLFKPPKRLVIREFTISFENSASIPDSYLECNTIKGEIAPGDEDTIRNTALHEVIDENSKRSREVNFTHVSTVGHLIVRQHKKIKCGVGAVVSKDIFEWPDGTNNPKKRVEIKVGPIIRDLKSTSDSRRAGCTTESIRRKPQTENNPTSSSTSSAETLASCENGDCSRTVTSCEGDCTRKTLSEETTYPPSSDELLSTGVTEATATTKPKETTLSMSSSQKPDRHQDEPCSEFDTDCMSLQSTSVEPQRVNETLEDCSGDCFSGSSEGSSRELPCDPNSDASCLCSGEDCVNEQNSTSSPGDSAQITIQDGELCKNGSESCICNGTSCSTQSSKKTNFLEAEARRTDVSLNETYEMTTKPVVILSRDSPPPQMDPKCNGTDGVCSERNLPPQLDPDEEKNSMGTVQPTIMDTHSNTGVSFEQGGTTVIPEVSGATKLSGEIGDTPATGNIPSCTQSGDENCSKVTPNDIIRPNAFSNDTDGNISSIEDSSSQKIPKNSSSTCPQGDEGCTTVQVNTEFVSPSHSTNKMTDTTSGSSGTETISPISEQSIPVTTNRFNDAENEIPTTRSYQEIDHVNDETSGLVFENSTDQETSTKKSSTDPIATDSTSHESLSSEKRSVTDCSTDAGNSSACVRPTVTHSPSLVDVSMVPSVSGTSDLPPAKSCDSSENCRSTDSSSRSDETNETVSGNAQDQTKTSSICDDGDESCQDSSSSSKSTETCEDGSTNCRSGSTGPISTSCDSASGSCSSETNESGTNSTIQLTHKELELPSRINDTVSSMSETRRSIAPTTPLPTPVKGRHRLALKIKILLEHIDENKENEKLVQVEKHLLLNENSSAHGNHSLMWQLQALNNSMNLETLKAIFNCSALESLSTDVIDVDKLSKDVVNDEIDHLKVKQKAQQKVYLKNTTVVPPKENSGSTNDDNQYDINDNLYENSNRRKKREITSPLDITTELENDTGSTTSVSVDNDIDTTTIVLVENGSDITTVVSGENGPDATTVVSGENGPDTTTSGSVDNFTDSTTVVSVENVTDTSTVVSVENIADSSTVFSVKEGTDSTTQKSIPQSLPAVEEDLTNGMNHVLSHICKELGELSTTDMNTTPSSFSSKILKILSDPSDRRVHFGIPEITPRIKREVTVQQLTRPVHGEEIGRWSKERFVSASGGGQIRRLTEFKILRDNIEDS